jgi:hypothetical protein
MIVEVSLDLFPCERLLPRARHQPGSDRNDCHDEHENQEAGEKVKRKRGVRSVR